MSRIAEHADAAESRVLLDWPARARKRSASGRGEGRVIAKEQLYRQRRPSTAIRTAMIQQVEQIVWEYSLTEATTNLAASPDVPEIQILRVCLREHELNESVLRYLDALIPFPMIFELDYEQKCRVIACHKRPPAKAGADWVGGEYFLSGWMPSGTGRESLPVALDLAGLYGQLLRTLVPLPNRPGESLSALMDRAEAVRRLRREITQAETRLSREKQFNRKVEINAELRKLKTQLEEIEQ